jgi:competence ComEA-like helix-hairpin-helix protein
MSQVKMKKGRLWEIVNLWWILLTFTLFFNWLAFFYIAYKVRNRKWGVWGLIYAIPFMLLMSFEGKMLDISVSFMLLGGIFSIFHAFRIRKEFLYRLEVMETVEKVEEIQLLHKIESEYGVRLQKEEVKKSRDIKNVANDNVKNMSLQSTISHTSRIQEEPPLVVDINNDSEEAIAKLPGVGIVLAKKAVALRQKNGGFSSVEEFSQALGLKPHTVERIRPHVIIKPIQSFEKQMSGRLVDF